MPAGEVAAAAAEVTSAVAKAAAQTTPAVAKAAEGAASAGATGAEVAAEGAVATTQGASTAVAEQAVNSGLAASAEKAVAQGPDAGLQTLAWGKPEPVETTGAKSDSSKEPGSATAQPPAEQGRDLSSPAEPTQTSESAGEQATKIDETTPDKNLPIADRLSSAKSIRDGAEQALDSYSGTDANELRQLERTFRKAESQYRDLQSESDRMLAEVRLSSMEQRLNITFEAKLTQVIEAIGKNNTEAFSKFKEYVDEKEPKKKEPLWQQLLIILLAAGKELLVGSGVSETVQQGTTSQRR